MPKADRCESCGRKFADLSGRVLLASIGSLFLLELLALSLGFNGETLRISIGAIAGLGGFGVGRALKGKVDRA